MNRDPDLDAPIDRLLQAARQGPSPERLENIGARLGSAVDAAQRLAQLRLLIGGSVAVVAISSAVWWFSRTTPETASEAATVAVQTAEPMPPVLRETDETSVAPVPEPTVPVVPEQVVHEQPETAAVTTELPNARRRTRADTMPSESASTVTPVVVPAVPEQPDELALLDAARHALSVDPDQALELCARHLALFPDGLLAQEREVLAISALSRSERCAQAHARLQQFESRWPRSAHIGGLARTLSERCDPSH